MRNEQRLHELAVKLSDRIDALRPKPPPQESLKAAFRAFADTLPQMVWTATADGRVTFFNRRYYDFTGATSCDWEAALHPDDRAPTREAWAAAVDTGKDFWHSARLLGADGNYHRGVTRAHAIYNGHGKVSYWIGSTAIDAEAAALRKVA